MSTRTRVPALGAEGWFTVDADEPALLGQKCTSCGTYAFPKADYGCPNPGCTGTEFSEVPLSRRGTVWSYTDARYQPPAPYVVPTDEHVPFAIAAVHLADEGLVVMGQMVAGVTVDDLSVGTEVELVVDVLFSDDDTDHLIWKWRPVTSAHSSTGGTSERGDA
ncbi:MAG: benzoylsuccinyl-CoA thiolase [Acidimicrobiales bacterium]|nr:benzoylsuccinyl-CoA thiolase [Acidimicrobiales bacterium]